jgi:glycosyltransferase involved in cell wall biosynthesis
MDNEPFGLAVAEMVRGGCIVFVPRNGGPMEIVGEDSRLLYATTEEAVRKILYVMKSSDEQVSIRTFLGLRNEMFFPENFISNIQEIIKQFSK